MKVEEKRSTYRCTTYLFAASSQYHGWPPRRRRHRCGRVASGSRQPAMRPWKAAMQGMQERKGNSEGRSPRAGMPAMARGVVPVLSSCPPSRRAATKEAAPVVHARASSALAAGKVGPIRCCVPWRAQSWLSWLPVACWSNLEPDCRGCAGVARLWPDVGGCGAGGPRVGTQGRYARVGEKKNSFLVETLSKLRFFGTL
jgi:hypothetical protein